MTIAVSLYSVKLYAVEDYVYRQGEHLAVHFVAVARLVPQALARLGFAAWFDVGAAASPWLGWLAERCATINER